jgi:hypothetical protein
VRSNYAVLTALTLEFQIIPCFRMKSESEQDGRTNTTAEKADVRANNVDSHCSLTRTQLKLLPRYGHVDNSEVVRIRLHVGPSAFMCQWVKLLEKPVLSLSWNSLPFTEPEGSLLYSEAPSAGSYSTLLLMSLCEST